MTSFYRTILYAFIVLLSVVYRLTNAQEDSTEATSLNETMNNIDSTTTLPVTNSSTTSVLNNSTTISITAITAASTSTIITNDTSITEATTSTIDSNLPPDVSSGPGWWLLIALLITIVIVIISGVIFYYRQHSPYRRFLRNWRSHDEDADNIILQLEQPEVTNGQWPPRISFT